MDKTVPNCIAFADVHCIAIGSLSEIAPKIQAAAEADPRARILVFDAETSEPIELDCRGTLADITNRIATATNAIAPVPEVQVPTPAGRGRPKLGVVAREVTLLPRHWEWLSAQPGGASVALRKLVEHARRSHSQADRIRLSQNACYRFMTAMAGDLAGFEEAARCLFAADRSGFEAQLSGWPKDIREHLGRLSEAAFETSITQEQRHV